MKGVTFRKGEIKFLRLNEICRIATCNKNLPHVTPVSFLRRENSILPQTTTP